MSYRLGYDFWICYCIWFVLLLFPLSRFPSSTIFLIWFFQGSTKFILNNPHYLVGCTKMAGTKWFRGNDWTLQNLAVPCSHLDLYVLLLFLLRLDTSNEGPHDQCKELIRLVACTCHSVCRRPAPTKRTLGIYDKGNTFLIS